MLSLSYVSAAERHYDQSTLIDMLKAFRRHNESVGVTGLLLYNGRGTFLQLIEGDEAVIGPLYNKIKADTRHSRVHCLRQKQIQERLFPEWSMGFHYMNEDSLQELEGYSDFLHSDEQAGYLMEHEDFSNAVFSHFKNLTQHKAFQ